MNQTPHHLARMQPDVDRITAERDRLKTALGRVFAAARYMSLEHPVEAAAIFAAMEAPADGLAEMVAAPPNPGVPSKKGAPMPWPRGSRSVS